VSKSVTCDGCGNTYQNIGAHWTKTDCERPQFSENQKNIITGLIMGDANIKVQSNNGNNFLRMEMITPTYLYFLDQEFGSLSTGVSFGRNGDKRNESDTDIGDNFSDTYIFRTRSHPYFNKMRDKWYPDGEKVFPNDIRLTPNTLKHWYCNDGSLNRSGSSPTIRIAATNEYGNSEKIYNIFEKSDIITPSNIHKSDNGSKSFDICFSVSDSDKLWKYMGNPLPAFEYKWPEQYR
jgi:hypothetical protein